MVTDLTAESAPQETPELPLRRNLRFQTYWIGATAGGTGIGITNLAFPLLILSTSGSASRAALFGAIQAGTQIVLGIPAGALADRMNRRGLLIAAELVRLVALAGVAAALWLNVLTWVQLLATAVAIGCAQALGGPARALILRTIVPRSQLTQALSQDEVRVNAAGMLGPMVAGSLFAVARIAPFLASMGGFLVSLCTACLVPFDGRPNGDAKGRTKGGALEGLRILWRNRALRWITAAAAMVNLAGAAVVLIVVVMLKQQHFSSAATGFALAGEALGGIAGATVTGRLHRWMQPGKLLLAVCWLCLPLMAALTVPLGPIWIFALMFTFAAGGPALLVMVDILVFRQAPDEVRGRVIAGTFMAFTVGAPLGSLIAGKLLDHFSPQTSILVVCALLAIPLSLVTAQRSLRDAVWPD
ncbi:MFS transporter [Streptomyces sp. SUK 48]|uniref:MFS transporter n=1 Tax=Streptomyces sp. SUK 48 TaxID=2582831 RepID=UPI00129B6776|nr:MFS transporter [Streptomyces sp. SUK 48]